MALNINADTVFAELLLGLTTLVQEESRWADRYPPGLIQAMNALALGMGDQFPATFTAFVALCHKPLHTWYPYKLSDFTEKYALLDSGQLTEQASDYLYSLPDEILRQHDWRGFIPTSVRDNWEMLRFLQDMRGMENTAEAQRLYAIIRSFLIVHSWITRRDLIQLGRQNVSEEIRNWLKSTFYESDDSGDEAYYCDHCGILRQVNGRLVGVKPSYCDDHHPDLPHIHKIATDGYTRMKYGIHLRTFIPGRTELAIFEAAESLQAEYADHLIDVARYPGLDAYDLRLVFRDEAWAVDVKDLADPRELSRKIQPMPDSKGLEHDKAYYVVPERRLRFEPDYLDQVRRHHKIKPPLFLYSQSEFCQHMRAKCVQLVKATR